MSNDFIDISSEINDLKHSLEEIRNSTIELLQSQEESIPKPKKQRILFEKSVECNINKADKLVRQCNPSYSFGKEAISASKPIPVPICDANYDVIIKNNSKYRRVPIAGFGHGDRFWKPDSSVSENPVIENKDNSKPTRITIQKGYSFGKAQRSQKVTIGVSDQNPIASKVTEKSSLLKSVAGKSKTFQRKIGTSEDQESLTVCNLTSVSSSTQIEISPSREKESTFAVDIFDKNLIDNGIQNMNGDGKENNNKEESIVEMNFCYSHPAVKDAFQNMESIEEEEDHSMLIPVKSDEIDSCESCIRDFDQNVDKENRNQETHRIESSPPNSIVTPETQIVKKIAPKRSISAPRHINSPNLNVMSTRFSSSSYQFRPESQQSERILTLKKRRLLEQVMMHSSQLHSNEVDSWELSSKGKIYHGQHRPRSAPSRRLVSNIERKLGPGCYDIAAADRWTRTQGPSFALYRSESKITPHVEKKRYWEDKQRDARDFHDQQRIADHSIIKKKAHVPRIRHGSVVEQDARISSILKAKKLNEELIAQNQQEINPKFSLVEPRVKSMTSFTPEETLHEIMKSNPKIALAFEKKNQINKQATDFYGPQLPAPWVEESQTNRKSKNLDSPSNSMENLKSLHADAYLRSSHSMSVSKNVAAIMRPSRSNFSKVPNHETPADFVGPQLPVDWLQQLNDAPNMSVRMSHSRGRDKIEMVSKDQVKIHEFNEWTIASSDALGPGYYDQENLVRFGDDAKGVVVMDKQLPRQEDALDSYGDDNYYIDDTDTRFFTELDHYDGGELRDLIDKKYEASGPLLYRKERYPSPSMEENENKEYQWFRGMYEEIRLRSKGVVDYERMQGRGDNVDDDNVNLVDRELAITKEEKTLDLDVYGDDNFTTTSKLLIFQDIEKYPRFRTTDNLQSDNELTPLSPKFSLIHKNISGGGVDMKKMTGREEFDSDEVDKMADEDINGRLASNEIQEHLHHRDIALQRAHIYLNETHQPFYVNMDNQSNPRDVSLPSSSSMNYSVPGDEGESRVDPLRHLDIANAHVVGGVGHWRLEQPLSRDVDGVIDNHELEIEDIDGNHPLDLEPNVQVLSTARGWSVSGISWDKSMGNRFPDAKVARASELDFQDIDSGKMKPGLAPLGQNGGGVLIQQQMGRYSKVEEDQLINTMSSNIDVDTENLAGRNLDLDIFSKDVFGKDAPGVSTFTKLPSSKSSHLTTPDPETQVIVDNTRDPSGDEIGRSGPKISFQHMTGRPMSRLEQSKQIEQWEPWLSSDILDISPSKDIQEKHIPAAVFPRQAIASRQTLNPTPFSIATSSSVQVTDKNNSVMKEKPTSTQVSSIEKGSDKIIQEQLDHQRNNDGKEAMVNKASSERKMKMKKEQMIDNSTKIKVESEMKKESKEESNATKALIDLSATQGTSEKVVVERKVTFDVPMKEKDSTTTTSRNVRISSKKPAKESGMTSSSLSINQDATKSSRKKESTTSSDKKEKIKPVGAKVQSINHRSTPTSTSTVSSSRASSSTSSTSSTSSRSMASRNSHNKDQESPPLSLDITERIQAPAFEAPHPPTINPLSQSLERRLRQLNL